MSIEKATECLRRFGLEDRIKIFSVSSATVPLAAKALGCEEGRIAKTLSFSDGDGAVLIVCAGDAKIDNRKYKDTFSKKPKMLDAEAAESIVGHAVGGVCPFGVNEGVKIFLDRSLLRFDKVYPAAGNASSAVELSVKELEFASGSLGYVDVTRLPNDD